MNDKTIPKAVFLMLKATCVAIESDKQETTCYTRDCDKGCVYGIVRSDGAVECLYEMISEAIASMTEE